VTGLGSPVANQVVAGLCQLQYQLRPDHTLWQITESGPVEIADGILAFSNPGDFSLMFLETNGDVVQDSPLWQRVVARNVLAGAVDDQGNPVNLQNASQFGVDNAGNVFALTPDGRLWRILDAGQSGAPVATVVRYGGQSFSIDRADTVFALSQDGHLDRGVNLDAPGAGSWTGIAANVEEYDVDKADTVFILQNGTVSRGLNFDTPGAESWTVIGYGMQSFTVDNADTVFNFGEEGTVYLGLGLDQPGGGSWTVIGYDMQSFTVDAADTVFNFGTDGRVWAGLGLDQPGPGSWTVIGYGMKSFTVDAADTVFNLGFDGRVWRRLNVDQTGTGNNWTVIGYGMKSFTVDSADTVYNIATNGVVWRGVGLDRPGGGNWTVLGTNEQDAQIAADGTVYMLNQVGNLSRIQNLDGGGAGTWTVMPGVKSFTLVGGGQGLVYIGTDGNLYQVVGGTTSLIHSGVESLKLGSDGSTVYYLATDGSIWKENSGQEISLTGISRSSNPPPAGTIPDLSGIWFINGTEATQVIQSGTSLAFVNESGNLSVGFYAGNNRVEASGWKLRGTLDLGGTIEYTPTGVRIAWDNGTTWDQGRIAGGWTIGAGRPTSVIQDGNKLLFLNEYGDWSAGYFTGSGQVEATDWGGLVGNLVPGPTGLQIQWANGTVWVKNPTVIL